MTQEALKLALEFAGSSTNRNELVAAIKKALAQTEQEPVFWYKSYPNGMYNGPIHNAQIGDVLRGSEEWIPLYTTPPQRTWVGLEGQEIRSLWEEATKPDRSTMTMVTSFAKSIEAKLKEKNT